jgi:hypothetical protein
VCALNDSKNASDLDRSTTSSTNIIVQQIQKDVQQLKHQADNRDREESTRQSRSEDDNDGSLNDDHEQCPADHRLSTVSSDLSIRRFLVEAETLVSSLAGGPQPPAAVVSEPLNSNENPQNDLSNDDTANDQFSAESIFNTPQCLEEDSADEDEAMNQSQLVERHLSIPPTTSVLDPVVFRLRTHITDWKGLDPEVFGQLLLHRIFITIWRGPHVHHYYLFERILLAVKDDAPMTPGERVALLTGFEDTPAPQHLEQLEVRPNKKLRGRFFFRNITEVASSDSSILGKFRLQITWRSEPQSNSQETFSILFPDRSTMCLWGDTVEHLWDHAMKSASHGAAQQPVRAGPTTTNTNAIDGSTEVEAS